MKKANIPFYKDPNKFPCGDSRKNTPQKNSPLVGATRRLQPQKHNVFLAKAGSEERTTHCNEVDGVERKAYTPKQTG